MAEPENVNAISGTWRVFVAVLAVLFLLAYGFGELSYQATVVALLFLLVVRG